MYTHHVWCCCPQPLQYDPPAGWPEKEGEAAIIPTDSTLTTASDVNALVYVG
jgi:hypothetical protein